MWIICVILALLSMHILWPNGGAWVLVAGFVLGTYAYVLYKIPEEYAKGAKEEGPTDPPL